jgi:hypothetical protein
LHALSRWEGLTRLADHGRIEHDNNTVERSSPFALNRKNASFAGSNGGAEHWATIASLIETRKLNDNDPLPYLNLTDVLTRIVHCCKTAKSINCCRGFTESKSSELWPENSAYDRGD